MSEEQTEFQIEEFIPIPSVFRWANREHTAIKEERPNSDMTFFIGKDSEQFQEIVDTGQVKDFIAFPVQPGNVDDERDRRIARFNFEGKAYQLDLNSQNRIASVGASARFAIMAGAAANDLKWYDPTYNFVWIATDNTETEMDAEKMAAFADAARQHVTRVTLAARDLKNKKPIPTDYTNDKYW